MRILHVAYIYPPNLRVADGITTVVYNVTKELAKRGHQVAVYTSDKLNLHTEDFLNEPELVINGVTSHYSRSLWRYKTFIVTPSIIPLLSRSIRNFDLVHIHDCRSFQGIFTYMFAAIKKIPYVFQPHGSYFSSSQDSLFKTVAKMTLDKLISNGIVKNASKVIALSKVEAEQYKLAGVPDDKIAVVPNGIDSSEYASLPAKGFFKKKFNIQSGKRIMLYLGRVHETKGIDLLIKAHAYLTRKMKCDDILLVIAGPDDGYLAEAKSLVDSLGTSDLALFTGFIDSSDKLEALVDADLFVTPSFFGFPMTFLEACAVGIPLITTTLGDTLEWINGNVGYVTQPTYQNLAKASYDILSDDELAERFSRNCRLIVRTDFSMENTVGKLEHIYSEVTGIDQRLKAISA